MPPITYDVPDPTTGLIDITVDADYSSERADHYRVTFSFGDGGIFHLVGNGGAIKDLFLDAIHILQAFDSEQLDVLLQDEVYDDMQQEWADEEYDDGNDPNW